MIIKYLELNAKCGLNYLCGGCEYYNCDIIVTDQLQIALDSKGLCVVVKLGSNTCF